MRNRQYQHLPNLLRKHRLDSGITLAQVAKVLGHRDARRVARWESGEEFPSLVNAFKLAAVHSVYVDALFFNLMDTVRSEIKLSLSEVLGKK